MCRPKNSKPLFLFVVAWLAEVATSVPPCPGATPYYLAANGQCYSSCPWDGSNNYYKYDVTLTCELVCPDPYNEHDPSRSCVHPCSSSSQFYLNSDCYAQCPWESPDKYYRYLPTNTCQLVCPDDYYGYDGNRSCVDTCPSEPTQTYYDTTNKRCVDECTANTFGYLGSVTASNQKCVTGILLFILSLPFWNIFRFRHQPLRRHLS